MIHLLSKKIWFPPVDESDEEGLVAAGGDLSVNRLLLAYRSGIFPWFEHDGMPFWFSPDPRMVLFPGDLIVSASMKKLFRQNYFTVTYNKEFKRVIQSCAAVKRKNDAGTWISKQFINAYTRLHGKGHAHSVEVWKDEKLAGGLYGVIIGKVFFGESMFSVLPNASKYGFISLIEKLRAENFQLIDCQVYSKHLESLGAGMISRSKYIALVNKATAG